MEITGKIKKIMDLQKVSDTFQKREFVLTVDYNSPYPQYVLFQTTQDKCVLLDALKVNDEVKVFFNIRGREWTSPQDNQVKYFVSLEAWRIDKFVNINKELDEFFNAIESRTPQEIQQVTHIPQAPQSSDEPQQTSSSDDGLPF